MVLDTYPNLASSSSHLCLLLDYRANFLFFACCFVLETWSLELRDERKLKVFENSVLRKGF